MLQLQDIHKSYDGKVILDGISLDINDGEIVSILGPSGSGKTTLLNAILGLTEIDGGRIVFDGKDLTGVPMKDRGFNIVFQDYALFPNLNAYENIVYGLRNKPNISTPAWSWPYQGPLQDRYCPSRKRTACRQGRDTRPYPLPPP